MRTALMLALYTVPAAILFGATLAMARVKRLELLPLERGAWLVPGVIYALTPPAPKGILNLIDPVVVALLCWLVFIARIAVGFKQPRANRAAAYGTIGLGAAIAIAAALFMPPLPQ